MLNQKEAHEHLLPLCPLNRCHPSPIFVEQMSMSVSASLTGQKNRREQPLKIHENNLSQTVRVIELAQKNRIPRIVFASSADVYGDVKPQVSHHFLTFYPHFPPTPLSRLLNFCDED